jgi:hypothetical protein
LPVHPASEAERIFLVIDGNLAMTVLLFVDLQISEAFLPIGLSRIPDKSEFV